MMTLFLYGTLLDADLLTRLAGRRLASAPASLAGWRGVYLRRTRYPTLRRARERIAGAVVRAGTAARARLAKYEGARYRLCAVTVRCNGRPLRARAWIGDAPTRRAWP